MASNGFSDVVENAVLNNLFNGTTISLDSGTWSPGDTVYVSLHTATPDDSGSNEVPGTLAGYARKAHSSWTTSSAGTLSNNGDITFDTITDTVDTATVTAVGIWTAASGGEFIAGGDVGTSKVLAENDIPKILSGELDISLA